LSIIIVLEINNLIKNRFRKTEFIYDLINGIENNIKFFGSHLSILNPVELDQEKKNKQFVLYENFIVDVGNFIKHHPGGQMAIEENLYSDVGRYLTGTQAYGPNFVAHDHKYMTIKYIINNLSYAELKDNHLIVKQPQYSFDKLDNMGYSDMFRLTPNSSSIYFNQENVTLLEKRIVAQDTYEYRFKIQNLLFAKFLPGVNWIGRHFSVSSKQENKTRYYSICATLDDKIKEHHNRLLQNLKLLENGQNININFIIESESYVNYLSLYIKHYNLKNALSNYIFNLTEGKVNDLIIRGPNVTH